MQNIKQTFFLETLIKMYNNHVVAHADTFMQLTVLTDSKRVTCNKTITLHNLIYVTYVLNSNKCLTSACMKKKARW